MGLQRKLRALLERQGLGTALSAPTTSRSKNKHLTYLIFHLFLICRPQKHKVFLATEHSCNLKVETVDCTALLALLVDSYRYQIVSLPFTPPGDAEAGCTWFTDPAEFLINFDLVNFPDPEKCQYKACKDRSQDIGPQWLLFSVSVSKKDTVLAAKLKVIVHVG